MRDHLVHRVCVSTELKNIILGFQLRFLILLVIEIMSIPFHHSQSQCFTIIIVSNLADSCDFLTIGLRILFQAVASSGAAVLCTIHQPSSEVFQLFDLVIFMKDGLIFYQGPVSDITPHFSRFGYDCPTNYNPSDFVMHLSQTESQSVLQTKGMFDFSAQRKLSNAGKSN